MLTIDFELEQSLQAIAQLEHSSPNEIVKNLISQYILQHQAVSSFGNIESSAEAVSPITQSLAGLLAKSNLSELDYKQHLADKY